GSFLGPFDLGADGKTDWMFWSQATDSLYIRYQLQSFVDRTAAAGLDLRVSGQAAAVADYDNDGDLEVFVINFSGTNLLLSGSRDGTFTDVALQAGVSRGNDGISCAWGDYDNDGWADLFVPGLNLKDKLFRNNGDGTFADSSQILRYDRSQRATSASWGDVNRDGFIDLLIGNFDGPNWLLINRGGKYFEDRAASFGLTESYRTESAVLVDVNLDSRLDIVTLNENGPARLLIATAAGTFVDSTATSGLNPENRSRKFGQSQSWGDFNGDGYPDLYITRIQDADMLFLNRGKSQGSLFQLKYNGQPEGEFGRMHSAIADFDSDGLPDLLVTRTSSVFNVYSSFPKSLLVLNDPLKLFPDPAAPPATGQNSNRLSPDQLGVILKRETSLPVTGDFDSDGNLDLLFVNYKPDNQNDLFHGSSLPLIYLANKASYGNSLVVRPRRDGRSAIGTRVVLYYGGKSWLQTVSGGSGRIQTGPRLLFSLGTTQFADSLAVWWPDGERFARQGPIFAGTLELLDDRQGPRIEVVSWPGGRSDGVVVSSSAGFSGKVSVTDNSGISLLSLVIRHPLTGGEDTTRLDISRPGPYQFALVSPAPGDTLLYYFTAADVFGNRSRLPASGGTYLQLVALSGVSRGDLNGDGRIDSEDLTRLLDIIQSKGNPPTSAELRAADLNSDGKVNIMDLLQLLPLLGKAKENVQIPIP
ncbi:MAG: FG-GAP-like repeat-containing protein, partial [Candidatus Glassbacteria bacterium]